jgi:hypothetical protein
MYDLVIDAMHTTALTKICSCPFAFSLQSPATLSQALFQGLLDQDQQMLDQNPKYVLLMSACATAVQPDSVCTGDQRVQW